MVMVIVSVVRPRARPRGRHFRQERSDAVVQKSGESDDVLIGQWGSFVEDRSRERTGARVDAVEDQPRDEVSDLVEPCANVPNGPTSAWNSASRRKSKPHMPHVSSVGSR